MTEDTDLRRPATCITNDTDADGDGLTVTAVNGGGDRPVDSGHLRLAQHGGERRLHLHLTNGHPAVQALGVGESLTDQFTYTITDGHGGTSTTTLSITINGDNDA